MAPCPKWGDGSKWGDGDFWCKQFGSTPFLGIVDLAVYRLSIRIAFTGTTDFYIDSIRPTTNINAQQPHHWQATADTDGGERLSVQVAYSSGASPGHDFYIDTIRLVTNIKRKQH